MAEPGRVGPHRPDCLRIRFADGWWHSAACEQRADRWAYSTVQAALASARADRPATVEEKQRCHAFAGAIEAWFANWRMQEIRGGG